MPNNIEPVYQGQMINRMRARLVNPSTPIPQAIPQGVTSGIALQLLMYQARNEQRNQDMAMLSELFNPPGIETIDSQPKPQRDRTMSNKAIKDFATLPLYQALKLAKVGFELETQSVDGNTWEEFENAEGDREPDFEAMSEAASERVSDLMSSEGKYDILTVLDNVRIQTRNELQELAEQLGFNSEDCEETDLHLWLFHKEMSIRNLTKVDTRLRDRIAEQLFTSIYENLDSSDYVNTRSPDDSEAPSYFGVNSNCFDLESDGSVDGPEIKTKDGGVTPTQFVKLASELFDKHDLAIDEGCSFHIHVSVQGVQHTFGKQFQADLYSYLIEHFDSLPASVKDRWLNEEKRNRYFELKISTDKFSFVNYHSRCGTWEFRCFGNVTNTQDARICMMLALNAMRYAYQCKLGLATRLIPDATNKDIVLLNDALENSSSVTQTKRDVRKFQSRQLQVEAMAA